MSWIVWRTDEAEQDFRSLSADVKKRVRAVEEDLASRGCEAGDYRLTGTGVDHLCCTHLKGRGGWRIIFGFAAEDEIAILAIGQHDQRKGRDLYADLYGELGLAAPPAGKRTKPPCCSDEGEGQLDVAFFDEIRGLG